MRIYKRHCTNCDKDFTCNGACKSDRLENPNDCYCFSCADKLVKMSQLSKDEIPKSFNVLQFGCSNTDKETVEFT